MLVTSEWKAQTVPLSCDDLEAWAWTLDQTSSVGFYNSDRAAGASQTHKHMQIVPLQTIAALRGPDALYVSPFPHSSSQLQFDGLNDISETYRVNVHTIYSAPHII